MPNLIFCSCSLEFPECWRRNKNYSNKKGESKNFRAAKDSSAI